MKRRPWILIVLAVIHFLAPFGNFFLSAWASGIEPSYYILKVMTPEYLSRNGLMIVLPIIAGFAIYACKRWSLYVYFISITALFAFSFVGYQSRAEMMSPWLLILVYLINLFVVIYFLIPAVRNIYFDRRMRWWEIRPRYTCDFSAQWNFEGDSVLHQGQVGNFSENGLFLKSDIFPKEQDMIEMRLSVSGLDSQALLGRVIFHKRADRLGFGVEFQHSPESKAFAKGLTEKLEDEGKRINTLEIRPEDSFTYWVRTLVTTGRGFLPSSKKVN